MCLNFLTAEAAVALMVAAVAGGGGDIENWVLFYSRVTFLEIITQNNQKFPILIVHLVTNG